MEFALSTSTRTDEPIHDFAVEEIPVTRYYLSDTAHTINI